MSEGYETGSRSDPWTAGTGQPRAELRGNSGSRGQAWREDPAGQDSVAGLLSGLLRDLQDLVRGEIALARTELKEDATTAGRGIAMIAAGAIVGLTGFIFLMLGATYLLNKWVEMWIAAAIVGAVLAVIAAIVASAGRGKLSATNMKPELSIDSLKEDKEWAKQQMNSVKK